MSYKLEKPCSEKQRLDFIVEYNHNNGLRIEETEDNIFALEEDEIMEGNVPVKNPNYEEEQIEKEKERIQRLSMTPLDFIKSLEQVGISYSQIKELCEANEQIDKELRFCSRVYRGNALLNQFAKDFGISSDMLDEMFKENGV